MKASLARYTVLLIVAAVFLVPTYMVVVNSLKSKADILASPLGLPIDRLSVDNYAGVLTQTSKFIVDAYLFSGVVALLVAAGVVMFSSSLSFVVARMRPPWGDRVFLLLFLGLIVPPQIVVIPVVKILAAIGLLHTAQGLILYLIALEMPFASFVYVGFIRSLPRDLEEAAEIDGAGRIRTFTRIVFPLLVPATASLFIIVFIWVWNDYINPAVILGPAGGNTVTTGIYQAFGAYQQDWGSIYANLVLATAPLVVVYFFTQRYIVGGLTVGAVKG